MNIKLFPTVLMQEEEKKVRSSFKRHIEKSIEKCKIAKPVDKKINFILPDQGATTATPAQAAGGENTTSNPEIPIE